VSRVIPLWIFGPLFVLFLSVIFLGEKLNNYEITAFLLITFVRRFFDFNPKNSGYF